MYYIHYILHNERQKISYLTRSDMKSLSLKNWTDKVLLEEGWPAAQSPQVRQALIESRANLAEAGLPVPAVEAMSRYDWVGQLLEGTLTRTAKGRVSWSDRLDRVLTHRLIGTCFFAALMVLVFEP